MMILVRATNALTKKKKKKMNDRTEKARTVDFEASENLASMFRAEDELGALSDLIPKAALACSELKISINESGFL